MPWEALRRAAKSVLIAPPGALQLASGNNRTFQVASVSPQGVRTRRRSKFSKALVLSAALVTVRVRRASVIWENAGMDGAGSNRMRARLVAKEAVAPWTPATRSAALPLAEGGSGSICRNEVSATGIKSTV